MKTNMEFIVKGYGVQYQVCLVIKVTGKFVERFGVYQDENDAEQEAEKLERQLQTCS